MTLHRSETGEIIFECNDCEDNLETLCRDFQAAQQELRACDWKARRAGSEWEHVCPDCQTDGDGPSDFDDVS